MIDPYNELDHQRPSYMSETEYVSQMLTKIKRFAQVGSVTCRAELPTRCLVGAVPGLFTRYWPRSGAAPGGQSCCWAQPWN